MGPGVQSGYKIYPNICIENTVHSEGLSILIRNRLNQTPIKQFGLDDSRLTVFGSKDGKSAKFSSSLVKLQFALVRAPYSVVSDRYRW